MTTSTITTEDLIRRHADDIAYVAEEPPATDLNACINQLDTAAERFDMAGINGSEDLETAAVHLGEAHDATDETARNVFLNRADELLSSIVWEMAQEYREMVGD